jgi:hypothetical protein
MDPLHQVQSCRWGGLTLFLPYPLWLMAEDCQWSCMRERPPKPLVNTDACASCQVWQPRAPAGRDGESDGLAVR